jgi:cytochrome c oxidase subunit 1
MLIFIPAGAGGLVNASNQMNAVVHNTLWVTGHFHLTVASSVTLTFFGIAYWLIPVVSNRVLTPRMHCLGIIQSVLWCVGMFFMSGAMHTVGLFGSPRRTAYTTYGGHPDAILWMPYHVVMAVLGMILFVSILILLYNIVIMLRSPKGYTEYPIGEVAETAEETPRLLERWEVWVTVSAVLILIAYTIPLMEMINNPVPGSEGYIMW